MWRPTPGYGAAEFSPELQSSDDRPDLQPPADEQEPQKQASDTLRPARHVRVARAVVVAVVVVSTGVEFGAGAFALYWFLRQRRPTNPSGEGGALSSALDLISP